MDFSEKLKSMIAQGIEASKDLIEKAQAQTKDLGRLGVIKMELMSYESEARKVSAELGALTYKLLSEKAETSITRKSDGVLELLHKLEVLNNEIETREDELKKLQAE